MCPERIQRKRTKGWRKPDGAVYVGRPTRWGNPFPTLVSTTYAKAEAVETFRLYVTRASWFPEFQQAARADLAGRDLVCWCPPDQPCHADVLLEIANARDDNLREPVYTCPVCCREAPWTDGTVAADGDERDEFWCQTCGTETPLADMEARP